MKKPMGRITLIYNNTKYISELIEYIDWGNCKNFGDFVKYFYESLNELTKIKLKLEDGSMMLFNKNLLENSIIHLEEVIIYND